jgi:hypothetical protein
VLHLFSCELQGYKAAGQYQIALANIKWVTDYFIKCIGDGKEIVVQVRPM